MPGGHLGRCGGPRYLLACWLLLWVVEMGLGPPPLPVSPAQRRFQCGTAPPLPLASHSHHTAGPPPSHPAHRPAKRGAAGKKEAPVAQEAGGAAKPARAPKRGRGGSQEEQEQAEPAGRGKRGRAAASAAASAAAATSEAPSESVQASERATRTRGGRGASAVGSKHEEEQGEVSTRRGRGRGQAATGAKAEAPATGRTTRSRR